MMACSLVIWMLPTVAALMLPNPSPGRVLISRCHVHLTETFCVSVGDAVEAFNMFALMQLDADVHCLEEFAGQWGLRGSCHRLGEVRQILDLLLSGNPEGVLGTEARASLYPVSERTSAAAQRAADVD